MDNANMLEQWVRQLSENDLPVLRQTVRSMEQARADIDNVNDRAIAAIILHDPLMTLRMLNLIRTEARTSKVKDVTSIAHATMMLGIDPFFRHCAGMHAVEDVLKVAPQALLHLLQVVRRSQRAAHYAFNWAVWRYDSNPEEVMIGALLHDLAELMVLCFAPDQALRIHAMQKAEPHMRSAAAQKAVLGFPLLDLQLALCRHYQLSDLLLKLMDDAHADHPRVLNVKLAAALARHSAHGWHDAALPDDFRAISNLLHITPEALQVRLGLKEAAP